MILLPLTLLAAPPAGYTPPPPRTVLEFFVPQRRSHVVDTRCGGGRLYLAWRSGGEGRVRFDEVRFNDQPAAAGDVALLDQAAAAFRRDVLVSAECDASGDARIVLWDGVAPGHARTGRIELERIGGVLSIVDG